MSSEPVPSSIPAPAPLPQLQPLQAWLARLGLSGKLLAIGGLVGVIAVFLPLLSMSIQMQTPLGAKPFVGKGAAKLPAVPAVSTSQSGMVPRDWRGGFSLVGFLA